MPVIVALELPGANNHGLEHDKSAGTSRLYWMAGSTGCTGSDWEVLVPVQPVGFHFTDGTATVLSLLSCDLFLTVFENPFL